MWRRGPLNPTISVPTEYPSDGSESHVHSPRRRSAHISHSQLVDTNTGFVNSVPNTQTFLPNTCYVDPFSSQSQSNSTSDVDWTGLVPSDLASTLTGSLLNQPIPALGKPSTANSPSSSRTFSGVFSSRSASASAEFGQSLTNVSPVAAFLNSDEQGEKVAKCSGNATPASNRVLEEADEPKHLTPKFRIGFGDDMAN
jgi:hypothetical protein